MTDSFRQAVDSLNDSLSRASLTIRGLKIGVEASVQLDDIFDLTWGYRIEGEKRTLHLVHRDGGEVVTLLGGQLVSLDIKRSCAAAIPALIDALRQNRIDRGASLQKAADDLDDYLGDILDDYLDGNLHD